MKESDVQRQILDYLKLKGIFHPDIICVINGQYVGIEVKAAKGKQSEHQKDFQQTLEAAGGKYILAYSLEDVLERISFIS